MKEGLEEEDACRQSLCVAAMEKLRMDYRNRLGEEDEIKFAKGKILGGEIASSPLIRNLASHVEGSAGF